MLNLRDYQHKLLDAARAKMRAGCKRLLIVAPCGSGKTVLMASMARGAVERGKRVQVWTHRRELVDQTIQTFVEAADIHTGVIAAGYPSAPLAPVQVCSVQTLAKRAHLATKPDIVVIDEAHHHVSTTYRALAALVPDAIFVGVTASPIRLDGRGLSECFDDFVVGPSTADLIARGFLSPYKFYAPGVRQLSLEDVHRVAGDYNKKELGAAMEKSSVIGDALSHYRAHCHDERALVFAWSLESSKAIAKQFIDAGIAAAHVDGETPVFERRRSMADFRSGALRVVCSCDLIGEGLDVPALDAVFLLRPTQSLGLYLQQVGRGLRPASGKEFVRIFDHVNNWQRHGLPDDERVWSLDGARTSRGKREAAGKRCPRCFGVARPSAPACPYCGAAFAMKPREVDQVDGVLAEANLDLLRQLGLEQATEIQQTRKPQSLAEWQVIAKSKGYRSGWAWRQFVFQQQRKRA